ncbi:ImmA/IrrE family metallo-endopeptidase [Brevibacillus sp. HB1.4B]|uniref:ImmA/IrrE family metallo-endopeptidase n=1 Tax=Brevibacillus sp. HB1.4B TaxID=2738845 RepID=UPI00156A79BC|nr:ImmA/IrrE family metallo-endopeptidase [Brevibacillus sp. HB1.4B]NRS20648.1 ImmA/IrrE family metallo-endopeptidase [Brevibacillus sp. HB1.4B]
MKETIRKLVKRYKTNCPFIISRELGIHIRYADLGQSTRGIYYRKLRRRFIVIHSDLSLEWQRFVCAHELGHDRLHKGLGYYFLEQNTLVNPGKFERQANEFAVKLLIFDDKVSGDDTTDEICLRNNIPIEMGKFI